MTQHYMDPPELGRRTTAKIRNGSNVTRFVDGRTATAKRYAALVSQLTADQGGGDLSEIRTQLLARFAGAAVLAEQVESRIVNKQPVDLEEYSVLISSLVRLASRLGIDRIPRNVTPSLTEYLDRARRGHDDEAQP